MQAPSILSLQRPHGIGQALTGIVKVMCLARGSHSSGRPKPSPQPLWYSHSISDTCVQQVQSSCLGCYVLHQTATQLSEQLPHARNCNALMGGTQSVQFRLWVAMYIRV